MATRQDKRGDPLTMIPKEYRLNSNRFQLFSREAKFKSHRLMLKSHPFFLLSNFNLKAPGDIEWILLHAKSCKST